MYIRICSRITIAYVCSAATIKKLTCLSLKSGRLLQSATVQHAPYTVIVFQRSALKLPAVVLMVHVPVRLRYDAPMQYMLLNLKIINREPEP